MTGISIAMMIVAMIIVWGGLIASILFLRRNPEVVGGPHEDPDLVLDDEQRAHQAHPTRDT
ncbi:methionine/alanine import family NSS transporter small subunit [Ornithinimicrobium tianjinense]|uniref:Methionine and alanine importer, small subunit n=1 Tax=Ornithinimicrobium tianjinense TaxID=1195761 RepID=A0A917F5I2_9MICO|nr:methionine/alanine import family NSS transporter small subunit [Ornithinimicrobium tianjinense]GGF45456.1 hypothetical protein GCM10011366_11470 [Ornithinimicrobium tianjinense]